MDHLWKELTRAWAVCLDVGHARVRFFRALSCLVVDLRTAQ